MTPRPTKISPISPQAHGPFLRRRKGRELVEAVNALLNMRGQRGVRITKAEAGPVFEIDETVLRELVEDLVSEVEPGTGTLNWQGVWDGDTVYSVGDIVIRPYAANMEDGKAGTFVSRTNENQGNEPPGGNAQDDTHWARLARACWDRFLVQDFGAPANGKADFLGGRCMLTLDNADPPTRIDLGRETRPAEMAGLTLAPEVWHVCDPDTGEAVEKIVIAATVPK